MMRWSGWFRLALAGLAGGIGVGAARGYVFDFNAAGQTRRWALLPTDTRVPATSVNASTRAIIYRLDVAGSGTGDAAAELNAIRSAFDQWQAVPGTVLKFEEGATVSGTKDVNSADGRNSVFWTKTTAVNGGRDNMSGVLSLTYVTTFVDNHVITDADLVLNGAEFRWFTNYEDPTTADVFVESIALHEVGHFIGLQHSPVGGATMLFLSDRGVNSQTGLASDDLAAARALYGTTATQAATGRISGNVVLGGDPIGGAAVFIEDAMGTLIAGTVTRTNGLYELAGLAPGSYTIRAAPLDPASGLNYLVRGTDIAAAYRDALTQFRPSVDVPVTLTAGARVTTNLVVTPTNPVRIVRVLRPSADLSTPFFNNKPVAIQRGGPALYVGILTTSPLAGNETLAVTGDGVSLGPVERRANALGSMTLVAAPLTVAPNATPGLRDVRLGRGTEVAWAHGFLEILGEFPDFNADGLDDRFQRRYWPRWTVAAGAPGADPDGDGFDNAWEAATGSVPTNRLSLNFAVESVRVTAEGARVRAQAAKGKRFQLFTRDTVPGADWRSVGAALTATTNVLEFLDTTATNRVRYYRVQALP